MFKYDLNSTKNEGRWRLKNPKWFFRYWRLKNPAQIRDFGDPDESCLKVPFTDGVSYVVGIPSRSKYQGIRHIYNASNGHKMQIAIQAIRFDKRVISEEQAAVWWEKNSHFFDKTWTESDWA